MFGRTRIKANRRRDSRSSSIASTGCSGSNYKLRLPPVLQGQRSAPNSEVLELLVDISHLDVSELACLGICNRAFREAVDAVLLRRAPVLLPYAIEQASDATADDRSTSKKHRASIALWLLGAIARAKVCLSPAVVPSAAAYCVNMDNIHQDVATGLVCAGLRVSFQQLLQAARNGTAGWEVWVKAAAAIGVERYNVPIGSGAAVLLLAGLPPWLEVLCYKPVGLVSAASCQQ
jgi:hypothetical protein